LAIHNLRASIAAIDRRASLITTGFRPSRTSAIALPCGWPAGSSLDPSRKEPYYEAKLHHPDGAVRVGGILNALPEKSIRIQQERGPVEFYAWDIAKFKGRTVSQKPYGQRREVYQAVIAEIRLFNRHLHVVPAMQRTGTLWSSTEPLSATLAACPGVKAWL